MSIRKYDFIVYVFLSVAAIFFVFQLAQLSACEEYAEKNNTESAYEVGQCLIKHPDGPWFTRNTYEQLAAIRAER